MTDGIILIDKPADMTSFGVVARVRRLLTEQQRLKHEKRGFCMPMQHKDAASSAESGKDYYNERATQPADAVLRGKPSERASSARPSGWRCKCHVKVGHTGTLDPFATGLMIIVVGKECKNAEMYSKKDKVYEATIRLGQSSTTGDPEGEIIDESDKVPKGEEITEVLLKFVGKITQRPPIYSAIKIDGQRAYKLAREGKTPEMPERQITIHSLDLIDYTYPELKIRAHVSSGTYIRTLAEDIGQSLGTAAYCSQLRRTAIDEWKIADAQTLQEFGVINP